MSFDYGLRYDVKADAGMSRLRRDGTAFNRHVDQAAGAAEEWGLRKLGLPPRHDLSLSGDGGWDGLISGHRLELYQVDWREDRRRLIINEDEPHRHADIYAVVRGTVDTHFEWEGCITHVEFLKRLEDRWERGGQVKLRLLLSQLDPIDWLEQLAKALRSPKGLKHPDNWYYWLLRDVGLIAPPICPKGT